MTHDTHTDFLEPIFGADTAPNVSLLHHLNDTMMITNRSLNLKKGTFIELSVNHGGKKYKINNAKIGRPIYIGQSLLWMYSHVCVL